MKILLAALCLAVSVFGAPPVGGTDYLPDIAKERHAALNEGVILKGGEKISTPIAFTPPVSIEIVARVDSTNLRMGYAADQVIFNWEVDGNQLRIDGGPAAGHHKQAAGAIPKKKFVTVKWVVTKDKQQIFVDGEQRFEHSGNYASINRPVSVWAGKDRVTVKSLKVEQIP